jgi:hypothetical protein
MEKLIGSRGPQKLRKVGKAFLFGERPVVFGTFADPNAIEKLEQSGFYVIDLDSEREKVLRGNEARNTLKILGQEVPPNKEYFQRDRDDSTDGSAELVS